MSNSQDPEILPTMETIAKRLGVSKMTVSRVLNNHPYVSEKVRKKVQGLMKELNYKPNLSAAVLSRRSSKTLGLILQFYNNNILSTNYLMDVLAGVEQAVDNSDYNLVLFSRITPKASLYEDITNWYFSGLVKGFMLVAPPINSPLVKTLIKEKIPFVTVSGGKEHKDVNWVDADNFSGGYMAAEYLIKLGHRKIAFIKGPYDSANSTDRENGFRKAMERHGIKIFREYMVAGEFEQKHAHKGITDLLESKDPPTAIFAANDLMALGAMQAVKEKRLNVPKDVSIVGFDNIDLALASEPTLTTINQDAVMLGKLAAEHLINYNKDKVNPVLQKTLEVSLVRRESTAPPKK